MLNYLILDTSTNIARIGLVRDDQLIADKMIDNKKKLSASLLIEIENLLKKNKLKPEDLKGIIVYLGPGSFTGLRIGVTVANTFAYSLNIPIVGIRGESFGEEKFSIAELKPQDLRELFKYGLKEMQNRKVGEFVIPFYGKEPNVGK